MPNRNNSLSTVRTANAETFVYVPPETAWNAGRILVKPNLGYPVGPPATVSMDVLGAVLRGLRRASPNGRILIIEGVSSKQPVEAIFEKSGLSALLDSEMRVADAESLIMAEFPNLLAEPIKYKHMTAPAYIAEFDCKISVGAFKRTMLHGEALISASLKNLYGLFPRDVYHARSPYARGQLHRPSVPLILRDIYFTIGHHFDGAVVDLKEKYVSPDWRPDRVRDVAHPVGKVVWGDDMIAVDQAACRVANEPVASYLQAIQALRDG